MLRLVCLFLGCDLPIQLLLKLLSSTYNNRLVYCFHYVLLGNWNSREMGTGTGMEQGMGTCKNHCYSSNSSLATASFIKLYKPSHWYAIVVKFFPLHKGLSNKLPCKTVYQLISFVIYYNYTILLCTLYLTLTAQVCYNCSNIWLNDIKFQYRNIGTYDLSV